MASEPQTVMQRMFARKTIAQVQRETASSELKRSLGKWNLLLLGVGCIIGAGEATGVLSSLFLSFTDVTGDVSNLAIGRKDVTSFFPAFIGMLWSEDALYEETIMEK